MKVRFYLFLLFFVYAASFVLGSNLHIVQGYQYIDEPQDDIVDNSGLIELFIDSATTPQDFSLSSVSVFRSDFQSDSIKEYAFYSRDYFSSVVNSSFFYDVSNVNIYRGFYNQTTSSDLYYFEMAERFDFYQNNECMFYQDNSYTLTFTNFTNYFVIYDNDDMSSAEKTCYFDSCDYISVRGYGYDKKWVLFDDDEIKVDYIFNEDSKTYDLRLYINAPFDIYYLRFSIGYNDSDLSGFNQSYMNSSKYSIFQVKGSNSNSTFECVENTSDKGLLKSIIQWLKDIKDSIVNVKDSIVDLPNKIAAAIKGFFDNVIDALSTLGEYIKNTLEFLFVLPDNSVDVMFSTFEDFMIEHFGALYQSIQLFYSFVADFQPDTTVEFIRLPKIDLNFMGSVFSFGGYEVDVVPNGFEWMFDSLKMLINIVLTFAFANVLKNKFDRFVGGGA